jgi:hypothetical protein
MILVDKSSRIHVVVLSTEVAVEVKAQGDLEVFMSWWKETARGRGAPVSIDGADWRLARLMLKTHGLDHLKELGVVFWSQHADPLVTGEYTRHMILFKSKLAETEKDLSMRA